MTLDSQYQSSGDLVKIPQKTFLWDMDGWHHKQLEEVDYGFIVEKTDNDFYKVLVGEEFWYVNINDVSWMGV